MIRRKKFIHLNAWILFAGIVTVAYLARFEKIKSIDYSALLVDEVEQPMRGKRVLVLDDSLDLYRDNFLATPFVNWQLSQDIFRNPDFYENVTQVYRAFKADPPELVIDRENLLGDFFNRMPEVKASYERQGDGYVRKN